MMTLRLQSALCISIVSSAFILACGMLLLLFYQHKHNRDMLDSGEYIAELIAKDKEIQQILITAQNPEDAVPLQPLLQRYIESNPYIESCTLFGAFHIQLVTVHKSNLKSNVSPELAESEHADLNQSVSKNQYDEQQFSLGSINGKELGKIRVQWDAKKGSMFRKNLERFVYLSTGICFAVVFAAAYLWILKRYSKEHFRLSKYVSQLISQEAAYRLDPRTFSKDIAEICTYINRLLTELEEARKHKILANDSYRQIERTQNDSVRQLEKQAKQMAAVYEELQEGLNRLFSILPCGLMIIDQEYRIQWSNNAIERLLRFANTDDEFIQDERIKRCLAPLVRFHTAEKISDICAWPQPSLGCAVSCRIQAVSIPTQDTVPLYFVTVEEDSGFPQQRTPEFFSHRLMLDVLSRMGEDSNQENVSEFSTQNKADLNEKLWQCLSRIERYQEFENNKFGKVTSIRLTQWLQTYFEKLDEYCEWVHITPQTVETDLMMKVSEEHLEEMVSVIMEIIMQKLAHSQNGKEPMTLRTYWNARGKAVIEWMIPGMVQDDIHYLKEAFGGRRPLYCDILNTEPVELDQLNHDICLTVFQFLREHFRAYAECMFAAGKHLGIVRIIIERYNFPEKNMQLETKENQENPEQKAKNKPEAEIKNILHNFLGKVEPERMAIMTKDK